MTEIVLLIIGGLLSFGLLMIVGLSAQVKRMQDEILDLQESCSRNEMNLMVITDYLERTIQSDRDLEIIVRDLNLDD